MNNKKKEIWFPAKKYGYGWGLPNCWQGWTVFTVYILLMTIGGLLAKSPAHMVIFIPYCISLTVLLIYICCKKGEKPKWRWGDKK